MDLYIPSSVLLKDKHSVLHNTPYSSSVPQPEANIRHRASKHTSYTGNYHLAEHEEQFDQPNSEDEAEEREYQQAKKQRAMAKQLKTEAKERQRDEKKARKLMDKEAKLLRQKSKRRQSVVRMSYQSNNSTIVSNGITPDTNGPNSEKASEASPILTLASSEQDQIADWNQPEMDKRQRGDKKPESDRTKPKGYFQQIWAKIRHRRSLAHSSKKGKQVQDYWGTEKKSHESTTITTSQAQGDIKSLISPPISPPLHKSDSRFANTSTTGTTTTAASLSLRNSLQMSQRNSSLFEQESTRTWRGLFAAVRQLSHSASTTGSSHMSSSSSSATSVSSLSVSAQPPRLPHLLLAEPLPQTLSVDKPKSPPVPARGPHGHKRQGSTLPPRHFQHRRQRSANARKVSIVLIGDGAVGKSAMALRFLRDQFHDEYDPTIEDSYCKHVEVDGQEYTLEITDTAGQEEYRGQQRNETFMKAADGFICIYSIESLSSFKELVGMRDQIWQTKESQNVPMIVAANKCDLEAAREVTVEAGKAFATESQAFFAETSAKTGFNIQEMVVELVRAIAKNSGRYQEVDKMFKESHHKECAATGAGGMLSPHSAACTGNGCCRVM
ncbi:Ras GTPase [Podila horticola]|nr:Ras GTPase [Podila horticola]